MSRWIRILGCLLVLLVIAELAVGQSRRRGSRRQVETDRYGVPSWDLHPTMPKDVFTFVRIRYSSNGQGRGWGGGRWTTDWPDAELNLSHRLHQMSSLQVNPEPQVLELTDPRLNDYPFIYIVEPGYLSFDANEVEALRNYLLAGGFLMIDDFWGIDEWENLEGELRQVFPSRPIEDLPATHEIFNLVFKLPPRPQLPSIHHEWYDGITWERDKGPTARDPHYRGIFDDKGRPMVIICHNTDLGDGWEREGENIDYFREFSEKIAYPLGINILFYAMTH